jgi:hypothetical protein
MTNKKNVSRATANQAEKVIAFARAYETLKTFKQNGELLAAYVIGFSIFEDRIRAMYVVRYRHEEKNEPSWGKINQSITQVIRYLTAHGDIPAENKEPFVQAAWSRNNIIHAAMWRPDSTTNDEVEAIIKLGRKADSLRRKQKRVFLSKT